MAATPSKPLDDSDFLLAGMEFVTKFDDPKVVVKKLVRSAAQALGSDMGSFYVLNREKQILEPYVTVNFPAEYAAACATVRIGEQCCGRAAKHKHPWVVEDMWTDPLFEEAREGAMILPEPEGSTRGGISPRRKERRSGTDRRKSQHR